MKLFTKGFQMMAYAHHGVLSMVLKTKNRSFLLCASRKAITKMPPDKQSFLGKRLYFESITHEDYRGFEIEFSGTKIAFH